MNISLLWWKAIEPTNDGNKESGVRDMYSVCLGDMDRLIYTYKNRDTTSHNRNKSTIRC